MLDTSGIAIDDNWIALLSFLPAGWQGKAKELKALSRIRCFADAEGLLRVLMIHLATGHSLRTTAALAREGGLANISDVALFKRIKLSGDWFLWMAQEMRKKWLMDIEKEFHPGLRVRAVDATTVKEPGIRGATWRIHYSLQLETLSCDEVHVTSEKKGESFVNFSVQNGDVFIADRGYCTSPGISYISNNKGYVVTRVRSALPLFDDQRNKFCILDHVQGLTQGKIRNFDLLIKNENEYLPCRVCVVRKSKEAIEKSKDAVLKRANSKGQRLRPETLKYAEYIIILSTLPFDFTNERIMELYRQRWQIELVFKRLKSLLGLGHLRKQDAESARTWLHGKLFVAMLLEVFIRAGEVFFPWGYPLTLAETKKSLA